jgi:hypothetical protein
MPAGVWAGQVIINKTFCLFDIWVFVVGDSMKPAIFTAELVVIRKAPVTEDIEINVVSLVVIAVGALKTAVDAVNDDLVVFVAF